VDIDLHLAKQFSPISSTDDGTQMDLRDAQSAKTLSEISRSDDPDSKSTRESEAQFTKLERAILTTVFGMQIDLRAEHASNAKSAI
jgi:hypothetical protein